MCTGVEIAALTVAVAGTATSTVAAIKANKAAKEEETQRANLEKLRAKRERVQQIRQARIQRAEILQQGANSGASESSSVATGAAGAYAQAFSNISYINSQESISKGLSNARRDQLNAQGYGILGKGMQDIGGAVFAHARDINDIFTPEPVPEEVVVTPSKIDDIPDWARP